ncbi:hypothetical protein ACFL33_00170 [Pseudomonadota bacterium]
MGFTPLAGPPWSGAAARVLCGPEFCFEETTMEWMQIALADLAGPVGARR